jgi:hypothetical protein
MAEARSRPPKSVQRLLRLVARAWNSQWIIDAGSTVSLAHVAPRGDFRCGLARCPQVVRDLIAAITLNRERGSPALGVRPDRRALGQPVTPIWGRASSHFETYTRVLTESNTYDFEITSGI